LSHKSASLVTSFHVATILAALAAHPIASLAQQATGTIIGVVQDASGSMIPNAAVSLSHPATGTTRMVRTNDRGEFTSPFMRVGEYVVTAEASGFKKRVVNGIVLQVDQTANVKLDLEVGQVNESVEVTAAAPLLETATSSLGQVIENRKILELPLNGRNTFALGLLAGNTIPITGMGTNLPFVAGGGRYASNDVLLDGIDNNTSINAGSIGRNGIAYTPSVDAVEEFKVKTNNFSAEFGRSAGAIISASLKSGTNEPHGSAWEFVRNEKFDANNFFSNANRVPRQPFKQNQYGFTLGGPVYLPKVYNGKNQTFFFFDYEATRRRTSASSSTLDIPPMDFRTGDFSSYAPRIYDPNARKIGPSGTVISTPFPNNIIPQNQLNKSSLAIVGLLPPPNAGAPGAAARNYVRIAPRPFDNDQLDARVDRRIGSKNTLFGRFSWFSSSQPDPGSFDGFIGGGSSTVKNGVSTAISDTHLFRPTLVNEVRAGYTRHNSSIYGVAPNGVGFANQNNVALFPFPVQGFPSIAFNYSGQVNTSTQFTGIGGGDSNLAIENTFQVTDNLSIIRSSHTFKVGGDFRRYRFENINGGGQLIFGSIFSSSNDVAGSGAPFADFLMGFLSGTQGGQLLDWSRQRDLYTGFYFQDDWKVTPRLTLNWGVRYELYTQPVDARDRGGLFDIRTLRTALPGKNGYTRAMVDGDHNNFAPRLGIAYQVTPKFIIRSGAGMFYARRDQNQQVTQFGGGIPNTPLVIFPNVSASATVTPPATINTPLQLGATDPNYSGFSAANPVSYLIRTADLHNNPNPYVFQWNWSMQRELFRDLLVEAAYSGEKGTKMVSRINFNQIPIEAAMAGRTAQSDRPVPFVNNTIGYDAAISNNIYNALNLRVEKRMRHGLNFLFNYTWSKNLESNGDGSSAWSQNGGTTFPLDSYNLAKERSYNPLDVPHVLNFSYGYELPFGPGKALLNHKGPASFVFGGWQINGIATRRSGFPTDIRSSRVASNNQVYASINVPDRVNGVSMYLPNKGVDGWFNPVAFTEPAQVRNVNGTPITLFGNAARRVGRGPGSVNTDFSLFKVFSFRERYRVQFRAEAFNLTNTPTFFLPSATNAALTIGNSNFGKLTSSSATGRQLQFGLKFLF
jgi:outer membrane receptor protein involved in Fe transport